jgi:predicted GNAT family acetyltransferase
VVGIGERSSSRSKQSAESDDDAGESEERRRKVNEGSQPEVQHETEKNRFAVHVEGETAVLSYERSEDEVVYTHTEVPSALEGKGIGSRLVRAGLDWARAEGLRVVPVCDFVAGYIERHPEYADLTKA